MLPHRSCRSNPPTKNKQGGRERDYTVNDIKVETNEPPKESHSLAVYANLFEEKGVEKEETDA